MKSSNNFEFNDLQGLICCGYGKLTETCFLLLNIVDAAAAKQWLSTAPVNSGLKTSPDTALQIAFSVEGLIALGISQSVIDGFSDEFIVGMSGDKNRSRRLGDIGANAPEHWVWGGDSNNVPHVLLLLYAKKNEIESWRKTVETKQFSTAFQLLNQLPTQDIGSIEPFGFKDGISQPKIDWDQQQDTDPHKRDNFTNLLAAGEVVLGYPNEYGLYTVRPLIDPKTDTLAKDLPNAEDQPSVKDFGRNGAYLVLRQLGQDVPGFWQFIDRLGDSAPAKREELAAAIVGRKIDGKPLVSSAADAIPGIPKEDSDNNFDFDSDSNGYQCPIGAHIRRSNPRTGDLPPPEATGLLNRLIKILGFGQKPEDDLVASARFHRLLRRGRSYGPILAPEDAVKPDAPIAERGLQFVCLVANISRQFEFVQNAWSMSSKFSGLQQESDPLLGHREPSLSGDPTDQFNRPNPAGPGQRTCPLPQFVTVHGGGYFFMPGLRALKYISALAINRSTHAS